MEEVCRRLAIPSTPTQLEGFTLRLQRGSGYRPDLQAKDRNKGGGKDVTPGNYKRLSDLFGNFRHDDLKTTGDRARDRAQLLGDVVEHQGLDDEEILSPVPGVGDVGYDESPSWLKVCRLHCLS